ncbi:MAG: molybdopterin-binding protein [Desulfobacterales bacterium]
MYKTVKIEDAIGLVLGHDVTEIRKEEFKGRAFKKGHRIESADICHFQRLGKEHIFVLEIDENHLHENDAAMALAKAFCGAGVGFQGEPKEGKLNLVAQRNGLLKVAVDALTDINLLGDVMCASRHSNTLVKAGDAVAGTRAIPLTIAKAVVNEAVRIAESHEGLFEVKALRRARTGLVITGNEVFTRLIEDRFEEVLRTKIDRIGSKVIGVAFAPDNASLIASDIQRLITQGADLILTTGGMSVDPDDVTRDGIRKAGGSAEFYGAPVLPGAMFMMADIDGVPILGIPACGLYHQTTILDLVLPRILAGERLNRKDIAQMGHGGLCLNCSQCRFPHCPFGKTP